MQQAMTGSIININSNLTDTCLRSCRRLHH